VKDDFKQRRSNQ